jgi:isocitrate lyase
MVANLEKTEEIHGTWSVSSRGRDAAWDARPVGQHGRRNQGGVIEMGTIGEQAAQLQREWETDPRWAGITRDYSARDVIRLRGCVAGEHSVARHGSSRLWDLLHRQDAAPALGAVVGDRAAEAAEAARAGLPAIYLPGWQAGDGSLAGGGYPGQSPHPGNPMPHLVRRVNNALLSADPPARAESPADGFGPGRRLTPVVADADADAGSGAVLGAFDLMTAMIEAGAAGVRFEDQLSPRAARGDGGGKVLVPTGQHIETLTAARLAADVLGVPSLIIARSGAHAASLLTSDIDERDHEFLIGERTAEGFHRVEPGWYACVTRELAFAPYADVLWLETPAPDLDVARAFACIIRSQYPDKLLAYSCPPPFTWRTHQDGASIAKFQMELAGMGYQFQSAIPAGCPGPAEPSSEPADRLARNHGPVYA